MDNPKKKFGHYDLAGPAIDRMRAAQDDNHSDPADVARALENFQNFSARFFESQIEFLNDPKLR